MKKTAWAFAALTATAASFAAADNLPQAGGETGAFAGLQEVQYQGVKPAAKNDDRVKFVYAAENVNTTPVAPAAPEQASPAAVPSAVPADMADPAAVTP